MKKQSTAAFTLVELLVVVAVLACLAAVLSPALARTRGSSQTDECQNNLRQLTAAWRMYADENADGLVYNEDGSGIGKTTGVNGIYQAGWVGGWLDASNTQSPDNADTRWVLSHQNNMNLLYYWSGHLGTYLKTASVFWCPADQSIGIWSGQVVPRARSFSMNNYLGPYSRTWTGQHAGVAVTAAARQGNSAYPLIDKSQNIRLPANIFVFMEDHEASINDGCFFTDPDTPYHLIKYPAGRHGWSGGLSFADGHLEVHRWRDSRTVPVTPPGQNMQLNVNLPGDEDVVWLANHAVGKP